MHVFKVIGFWVQSWSIFSPISSSIDFCVPFIVRVMSLLFWKWPVYIQSIAFSLGCKISQLAPLGIARAKRRLLCPFFRNSPSAKFSCNSYCYYPLGLLCVNVVVAAFFSFKTMHSMNPMHLWAAFMRVCACLPVFIRIILPMCKCT